MAPRCDSEMQAPTGIGELLLAQAHDVVEVERLVALDERRAGARIAGRTVREPPPHAGLAQRLHAARAWSGVWMLCSQAWIVVIPPVDGLREPETHAAVRIFRRERGAVGEHHRAEIVRERAVAGAASQHRRPHVPVGVDQPGHGDHPSAVDDLGAHAVEPPPNAGDPVALDRHVARLQRPQRLAVHGQQIRVTDQIARHDSSSAPAWG